jgi:hypothetical protein
MERSGGLAGSWGNHCLAMRLPFLDIGPDRMSGPMHPSGASAPPLVYPRTPAAGVAKTTGSHPRCRIWPHGSAKTNMVAEPCGRCQKLVIPPDITATYCLPSTA